MILGQSRIGFGGGGTVKASVQILKYLLHTIITYLCDVIKICLHAGRAEKYTYYANFYLRKIVIHKLLILNMLPKKIIIYFLYSTCQSQGYTLQLHILEIIMSS